MPAARSRFVNDGGTNQEGVYWRYEMAIRARESALASVTAGNGAIYATRREAYIEVDPVMGHDLSFPFNMVKRGWRAVYVPGARATERMVPSIEGEFARKRRMMSHTWPIVLRGGLLSPRGYSPTYALMIASHRVLRYASPFLHLVALVANAFLLGAGLGLRRDVRDPARGDRRGARRTRDPRARPLLIARYYVLTTASIAAGLYDWLRHGTTAGWDAGGGHAMIRARCSTSSCRAPRCSLPSPMLLAAVVAIRARVARRRDLPPAPRRPRRPRVRRAEAAHDGRRRRAHRRRDWRSTRATTGSRASGALLRRTSLDEMPNLLNVLRGEMAIIGPRPTLPSQVAQYTERQRGRLAIRPGITGWAQVNGRASLPWPQRIELDLWYIEHRSWRLDAQILVRTVRMVLGGEGTYKGETGGWVDPS